MPRNNNNKRKTPATTTTTTTSSVKNLRLYQKSYKGGGPKDKPYFDVFRQTQIFTQAKTVLYPGCHRHLTTSLVFPCVTYVDCDNKVADLYSETAAQEFVDLHKLYNDDEEEEEDQCRYEFFCDDVCRPPTTNRKNKKTTWRKDDHYELLISLSAGILAKSCTPYIRRRRGDAGGWLLINDSHSDARSIFVDSFLQQDDDDEAAAGSCKWQLKAYWDDQQGKFVTDPENLQRCFRVVDKKTKQESRISKDQVEESINVGSISRRSFSLPFAPMFYLFQLQHQQSATATET